MTFRKVWTDLADARGQAAIQRFTASREPGHSITHSPLMIGDSVSIQNHTGNRPLKWMNTGTIVETLPHRQYRVLVDGSRRVTLRNRRFLHKINPLAREKRLPDCTTPPACQTIFDTTPRKLPQDVQLSRSLPLLPVTTVPDTPHIPSVPHSATPAASKVRPDHTDICVRDVPTVITDSTAPSLSTPPPSQCTPPPTVRPSRTKRIPRRLLDYVLN